MAEAAANVAKEAKSEHQALKELLKTRDPWEKEVDFQRKSLRRRYLHLLLVHPLAPESRDAENHLWMQTSYAFISSYKQKIQSLDQVLHGNSSNRGGHSASQIKQGSHGPVEHRKLVNRFRQFLAEEEKFWTQLVLRLRRSWGLQEVQQSLITLGFATEEPSTAGTTETEVSQVNDRNPYQFPPEEAAVLDFSPDQRRGRLAIFSKALTCLGDIARYREQYNESGGRPRAGHDDSVPSRRGRHRRGGSTLLDAIPRARNYDKAQKCYEQARSIMPTEGNPFHQLAILASYKKDSFLTIVQYYRSLCLKHPYETAADNLSTILNKALEAWKSGSHSHLVQKGDQPAPDKDLPPRIRIENFKEKVVVLHALWNSGNDKMDSIARKHAQEVYEDFYKLLSERHLPIEMISNVIVLSEAALWTHRMVRDSGSPKPSRRGDDMPVRINSMGSESRIFSHLLALHKALLEVGLEQLKEPPPLDSQENDLAQRITAVFRRTLPALRIASKWLRANFSYTIYGPDIKSSKGSAQMQKRNDLKSTRRQNDLKSFWEVYSAFVRALSRAFPQNRLPSMTGLLDEDMDVRGFLPLRKLMGDVVEIFKDSSDGDNGNPAEPKRIQGEVHPNVLELMRIADLIADARLLVDITDSPLALYGNQFVLKGIEAEVAPAFVTDAESKGEDFVDPGGPVEVPGDQFDEDGSSTHTDDDVLREAFSCLDERNKVGDIDDEGDDEIVWDPKGTVSPKEQALPAASVNHSFTTPDTSKGPPSPIHRQGSLKLGTTARDLLNDVMGYNRVSTGHTSTSGSLMSSAPQPRLLFGSESSNSLGHSIWSTSGDEPSLPFSSPNTTPHLSTSHYRQRSSGFSRDSTFQSIWSAPQQPNLDANNHIYESPPPALQNSQIPYEFPPIMPTGNAFIAQQRPPVIFSEASAGGPHYVQPPSGQSNFANVVQLPASVGNSTEGQFHGPHHGHNHIPLAGHVRQPSSNDLPVGTLPPQNANIWGNFR